MTGPLYRMITFSNLNNGRHFVIRKPDRTSFSMLNGKTVRWIIDKTISIEMMLLIFLIGYYLVIDIPIP